MTDHKTIRLVIRYLGLITLLLVLGLLWLAHKGMTIDAGFWTLAGTGLGGLATMLASTRGGSQQDPTPVVVQQPDDDPVPVDPTDAGHINVLEALVIVICIVVLLQLLGVHL